jgi:hypothetical protein
MPPTRRSSTNGAKAKEDWLAASERTRERPWAYEELLFGSAEERARAKELQRVLHEIETERQELARLHEEIDAHLGRTATLDRRLEELTTSGDTTISSAASRPTLPHAREEGDNGSRVYAYDARSRVLARCEGFDVESPEGPVGFVEGVRFVSRIDRPDMLEVRGGRLGRQLILVPIEQVEEIRLDEELVVLHSMPPVPARDLLDDLGDRLRRALHFDHARDTPLSE